MRRTVFRLCPVLALLSYVGSYGILSRLGFTEADRYGIRGFYFFLPDGTARTSLLNQGGVVIYYPLITVDGWLGTGRPPASEPMVDLS